jgi:hypothetical protein
VRGKTALLAWSATGSNDLWVAMGSVTERGVRFARSVSLTAFLAEAPVAAAPSAAILPDGRLLIVFEDPTSRDLFYLSGRMTGPDRFLAFDGGVHRLESAPGIPAEGMDATVTAAPDGAVTIVYSGADGGRLTALSGRLGADGRLDASAAPVAVGMNLP